nr:DMT family transporter [Microbacterium suaedae]
MISPGVLWGFVGVVAFSFTLPVTRFAVEAGIPATFLGSARAVVAAALAVIALAFTRQRLPLRRLWPRLAVVAAGVVVGFPLLTSYALETTEASHGAVVIALLPAATAVIAVLRGRERPGARFWIAAGLGAVAAVAFAAVNGGGFGSFASADLLLLGAVVAAGVGYAEGGLLARELGAWQTISWALVLSAPVMLVVSAASAATEPITASPAAWGAFAYLGVVSMFLGFFAWYRGLAIGPMSIVSQVQLTQPVMSLVWAALLLGEVLRWETAVGVVAVIACAAFAVRSRR